MAIPNNAIDVQIFRFDQEFYNANENNLSELKKKYPLFFPSHVPDSVWLNKIEDNDEKELYAEVQKKYSDISNLRADLELLFRYVLYYNKEFVVPDVFTVLTNVDYQYRVLHASPNLTISLDVYLGKDHEFYGDFPSYIKENFNSEHIVVDVAKQIINDQIKQNYDRTLLGKMIHEGKRMYLVDLYLPFVSDKLKIGFQDEKLKWALENEEYVWRYFIENKLLYSTDTKLNKRFIDEAPFSKFFLTEDSKSPGQIGVWVGWQIVRSFMEKNDVSLQSLLEMKADDIFKRSNYKPRK